MYNILSCTVHTYSMYVHNICNINNMYDKYTVYIRTVCIHAAYSYMHTKNQSTSCVYCLYCVCTMLWRNENAKVDLLAKKFFIRRQVLRFSFPRFGVSIFIVLSRVNVDIHNERITWSP
jgi:hypothetical protein